MLETLKLNYPEWITEEVVTIFENDEQCTTCHDLVPIEGTPIEGTNYAWSMRFQTHRTAWAKHCYKKKSANDCKACGREEAGS